jgi:beta-phosphoglucomutase-like phosphatase (HAD superfamily)
MQVPAAIATSAPEARVGPALKQAGLDSMFAAVITADDVHRGRPDPEAYLYAAQQIGRPPARVVVVGNSNQVGCDGSAAIDMHPVLVLLPEAYHAGWLQCAKLGRVGPCIACFADLKACDQAKPAVWGCGGNAVRIKVPKARDRICWILESTPLRWQVWFVSSLLQQML